MIGKKINQLATELAPVSTDLTIIGDPDSGVSKKITLAQLGAIFSGAVSFYTNLAAFPVTGDINVIYCAKDTQKLYLWSGSAYVEVFPSQALLDTYQLRSEKGVSNGYASLDSAGKVPISQLPSSIMEYKGTWNASTNTPTLANGTGDTGDVYICNVAGTVNFGAGPITFAVGDYVIYSGTIWQRSSGAVGTVTSVAASITGDAIGITGSPITTSGTLALAFAGTSAQYINGAGNLTTFPTSLVSGSGASGQVTFFNGANSVTGTNNFFWDATNNRLGIGTTTPQRSIEIYNTTADNHLRLSGNAPSVSMGEAVTGSIYQAKFGLVTVNGQFVTAGVAGDFVIISQTGATIIGTSSTEKMRVQSSGNVSINNTNDTYKLDVTGTGRFTGQLRLESTITDGTYTYTLPSATGTLALTSAIPANPVGGSGTTNYLPKFTGASTIGNSLVVDNGTNIGIGTTNPTAGRLQINVSDTTTAAHFQIVDGTTTLANAFVTNFRNANDGNGRYSLSSWQVQNAVGNDQNGFIGVQSVTGASAYTPNIVFGQKTGASSYATRMTLDASGNLGLGVTPSAWGYGGNFNLEGAGRYISSKSDDTRYASNVYNDGSNEVYSSTGFATRYRQANGIHSWVTAPSGTAGNAISFTQAMTLDANGRLGIGTTSPGNYYSTKLVVGVGDEDGITIAGSGDNFLMFADGQTGLDRYRGFIHYNHDSNFLAFGSDGVERLRIASTGAATFSSSVKVNGTPAATSGILSVVTSTSTLGVTDGLGLLISNGGSVGQMAQIGFGYSESRSAAVIGGIISNGAGATTSDLFFATRSTTTGSDAPAERMRITSGGNVGIGTTSPAKTLTVVNTAEQLRIAYDGTVYTDFRNDSAGGLLVNTSGGYIINYIGGTERLRIKTNTINISSIPTSSAGLSSGDLYSSAGVLMIV